MFVLGETVYVPFPNDLTGSSFEVLTLTHTVYVPLKFLSTQLKFYAACIVVSLKSFSFLC
jgi:hypothetical protein